MVDFDVPLLKESRAYIRRLERGVEAFQECRYHKSRRTNWSYRYASRFHAAEADLFRQNPRAYLDVPAQPEPRVEDVYSQPVSKRKVLEVIAKVGAHWTFAAVGRLAGLALPDSKARTYRKCYVDEMENIFDPDEAAIVRYVFPFPLSVKRQLRYLRYLVRRRYPFRLAGYPYDIRDLLHFLARRDVLSLKRLETRAQLRLGRAIRRQRNWTTIQLSDEFDICSIDFVRAVKRSDLHIVNSAHGVGKYFPIHAYDEFRILMMGQADYYRAITQCRYIKQELRSSGQDAGWVEGDTGQVMQFVFVSQTSSRSGAYIDRCEAEVLQGLLTAFSGREDIELWIKVHPNRVQPIKAQGFKILPGLSALRSPQDSVFVSFFSTSHIDPAFKGRRYLLSYGLLQPAIAFDDDGSILDLDGLVTEISELLLKRKTANAHSSDGRIHD
ncbi:UNVERIFIED_ORG: hypothetical protein J2W19_005013 [Shinella zoogloeoides]|jgi:hypothetical protein|nr:hypothetical protein [Shinella zoogloeoides]